MSSSPKGEKANARCARNGGSRCGEPRGRAGGTSTGRRFPPRTFRAVADNLKAIVAYGAYKRSLGVGEQQLSEAARLTAHAISTEAQAVDDWEDEGGASQ